MCRFGTGGHLEVLLGHPGGPFYARKDAGVWGIPKGLVEPGETPLDAARREFREETGFPPAPADDAYLPLGEVKTSKGKVVRAWAFLGDADPAALSSNPFELEWPPKSGRRVAFPEIDRVVWATLPQAESLLLGYQRPFLPRLASTGERLRATAG
ncbi:MAG TPA: NUDIX domain-containing protein [Polyangiaceae bacterium LLY-WYZ-14_1]|nr:NUDIX domain-containing protein [Polyangiaceae bacterium LLY-WYZ-14_1]